MIRIPLHPVRKGRPKCATRNAALLAGATHYKGKPCHKKHGGVRYVSTGACVDCYKAARSVTDSFDDIFA